MKVQYMACARSSAVDRTTNELSLFQVLDEIAAPTYPLQILSFCVAALFERQPDDEAVQNYVITIALDGALLASFSMHVDFAASLRNRSVNTIRNLAIPAPGVLGISLLQKDMVMASWEAVAVQTGTPVKAAAVAPQDLAPNEVRPVEPKSGPLVN